MKNRCKVLNELKETITLEQGNLNSIRKLYVRQLLIDQKVHKKIELSQDSRSQKYKQQLTKNMFYKPSYCC